MLLFINEGKIASPPLGLQSLMKILYIIDSGGLNGAGITMHRRNDQNEICEWLDRIVLTRLDAVVLVSEMMCKNFNFNHLKKNAFRVIQNQGSAKDIRMLWRKERGSYFLSCKKLPFNMQEAWCHGKRSTATVVGGQIPYVFKRVIFKIVKEYIPWRHEGNF